MHCEWLTKGQSKALIIFFNGFGMDAGCIARLQEENAQTKAYDCLHIHDYRNADLPLFDFSAYKRLYLVAWSMGVYMSNTLNLPWTKKIAFCGTGSPIDAKKGIPPRIYRLTVQNFSEKAKTLFAEKTGFAADSRRTAKSLQEELAAIEQYDFCKDSRFSTAFIAEDDTIFPPANQNNYWTDYADTVHIIKSKHYPFHLFSSWQEIIDA